MSRPKILTDRELATIGQEAKKAVPTKCGFDRCASLPFQCGSGAFVDYEKSPRDHSRIDRFRGRSEHANGPFLRFPQGKVCVFAGETQHRCSELAWNKSKIALRAHQSRTRSWSKVPNLYLVSRPRTGKKRASGDERLLSYTLSIPSMCALEDGRSSSPTETFSVNAWLVGTFSRVRHRVAAGRWAFLTGGGRFVLSIFLSVVFAVPLYGASGTPHRSASILEQRLFSVSSYGAIGDGSVGANHTGHDSTRAINAAIGAACAAGGGKVTFPRGVFNIGLNSTVPRPLSGVAAIVIPCSNITLSGAGTDATVLSFWLISDGHLVAPTSICPRNIDVTNISKPRVWRGSAIYIVGGRTAASPTANITIRDLRVTGNANINGDNTNPVQWDGTLPLPQTSRCNAWDTSNKGIYLQNDDFSRGAQGVDSGGYYPPTPSYFANIAIIDTHIDHFLGELIYGGNSTITRSLIESNHLDHSNGDCVSVGGGWDFRNNFCHDVFANGFEDSPSIHPQIYEGNKIETVQLDGIAITNLAYNQDINEDSAPITIVHNSIREIGRNGIALYNAIHVHILNNTITDSAWGILLHDLGTEQPTPSPSYPGPPPPVLLSQPAGSNLPRMSIFVSVGWIYPASSEFDRERVSQLSSDNVISVSSGQSVIIKTPVPPPLNTVPYPSRWEVFAGNSPTTEHLQSTSIPLGTNSVLTIPPSSTGLSSQLLKGALDSPTAAPLLQVVKGGTIVHGVYDIATVWIVPTMFEYLLSPPSPKSTVSISTDGSRILVSEPDSPPANVSGYLVFAGLRGGTLTLQNSEGMICQLRSTCVISGALNAHALRIPGAHGSALSPNVTDIEVSNNTIVADNMNVHAGIQCCGTPIIRPFLRKVVISNNIVSSTPSGREKGYKVNRIVNLPNVGVSTSNAQSLSPDSPAALENLIETGNGEN